MLTNRLADKSKLSTQSRVAVSAIVAMERVTRSRHHRGYWHAVREIGKLSDETTAIQLPQGLLLVQVGDPYWARIIAPGYLYEPEIATWLERLTGKEVDLLDVGANIGYWSVYFSGLFPEARVTAIEPNPHVFDQLQKNAELNGQRFECVQSAVTPEPIDTIELQVSDTRSGHAAATVDPRKASQDLVSVAVPATTLDALVARVRRPGIPLLVKLDIEGLEATVLSASASTSDLEIAFIYEDHGQDAACETTDLLLQSTEFEIYYLSALANPELITSIGQLRARKTSQKVGYNLLAVPREGPWQALKEEH